MITKKKITSKCSKKWKHKTWAVIEIKAEIWLHWWQYHFNRNYKRALPRLCSRSVELCDPIFRTKKKTPGKMWREMVNKNNSENWGKYLLKWCRHCSTNLMKSGCFPCFMAVIPSFMCESTHFIFVICASILSLMLSLSLSNICVQVHAIFNSAKSMDIFRLAFDSSAMENAHHFQLLFQISFHVAIFALFSLRRKALKNMENVTIEKMLLFWCVRKRKFSL